MYPTVFDLTGVLLVYMYSLIYIQYDRKLLRIAFFIICLSQLV